MFICDGHFLAKYAVVIKDGKVQEKIKSVDSDLKIAARLVGFDSNTGAELVDFISIDEVVFLLEGMPESLKSLIPDNIRTFNLTKTTSESLEEKDVGV